MSVFRLIRSIQLADQYERYKKKKPSAADQKLTHCIRCGLCCHCGPPSLSKEDAKNIATSLILHQDEFVQRYCIVNRLKGTPWTFYLARKSQLKHAGKVLPWEQTRVFDSPCCFYEEARGCLLEKVKPTICKKYVCWNPQEGQSPEALQISEFSKEEIETLTGGVDWEEEDE